MRLQLCLCSLEVVWLLLENPLHLEGLFHLSLNYSNTSKLSCSTAVIFTTIAEFQALDESCREKGFSLGEYVHDQFDIKDFYKIVSQPNFHRTHRSAFVVDYLLYDLALIISSYWLTS